MWIDNGTNLLAKGDGFFISYNNQKNKDPLAETIEDFFGKPAKEPETAIVIIDGKGKDHNTYLILNGDFRKEYESLIPKGLYACKEFFLANQDKRSNWSD